MVKAKDVIGLVRDTLREWLADNVSLSGAALAYYAVFSLAPVLVIALAIASQVFGHEAASGHLTARIEDAVGPRVAGAIEEILLRTAESGSGTVATLVSIGLLLFSATAMFGQLQHALNTVWGVQARTDRGWLVTIKERSWSFLVVLGIGVLLLASQVLGTGLSRVATFVPSAQLWRGVHWLVSLGFTTLFFAMIYKLLPDVKITWRDTWIGAATTALFFNLGNYLINLYLAHNSGLSAYGAAGSVIVILLWVFYSSQIFLLGAEFTQVYANKFGQPLVAEDRARPVAEGAKAGTRRDPVSANGPYQPLHSPAS